MLGIYAFALIFMVFALGDFVAIKTKAAVSLMLTASVVFLVAFWCGFPPNVFEVSGLMQLMTVTVSMLLVHMGSTIKIKDFIQEWKTVVIVIASTSAICLGVYFIGGIFMDKHLMLAGAPILGGGMTAFLVMQDIFTKMDEPSVIVFGSLVLAMQGLVGLPLGSLLCKKEGKRYCKDMREGKVILNAPLKAEDVEPRKKLFPAIPSQYNGDNLIVTKVALIGCLATWLSSLTGGKINTLIIALVLGVLFSELGILDENALVKGKAFTIILVAALVPAFAGLGGATPALILSLMKPLLVVIVVGLACCLIVSVVVGKIFKQSWYLSFALGVTALIGFPGTFLISSEVANAIGETQKEVDGILAHIMPKMIIAGMTSVSVISVVFATLMANWA